MFGSRARAGVGLAIDQLRHYRVRTVLAVIAVALAVLSTTLLAGVGVGVLETGTEKFAEADRDLWVTGGPTRIQPGSVGGFENAILDSHPLADELQARPEVQQASPLGFQTVYVGTEPADLQSIVGVGVPGVGGSRIQVTEGRAFDQGDVHYAGGAYDGPMTREVIIDPRTARLLNVTVGDRIHVGGTISSARANEFEVVGISPTFTQFLGAPTVTLHLSELQELTGTTGTDRAALLTLALEPGADPEAVAAELQADYPEYDVRTNREQLQSVLQGQAVVVAGATVLVVLAVVAGIALTVNAFVLLVYQQRRAIAALKAGGVSWRTLLWMIAGQALVVGLLGGALGLAGTAPLASALNIVAERVVGFGGLVRTPEWVYLAGAGLAVGIGLLAAVAAGWRLMGIEPLAALGD